ncbi:MAG: hypothetical protein KIT74_07575 [Fimbriimonadales bacterium]|nr:hypothetical protein [Fimbriimonadales bacterium]
MKLLPFLAAFSVLVIGCSGAAKSEAKAEEPEVIKGDGYTVTKQPVEGPVVPVYPDKTKPERDEKPKQSSYDTPYNPDPSKNAADGQAFKPVEATPKKEEPKAATTR